MHNLKRRITSTILAFALVLVGLPHYVSAGEVDHGSIVKTAAVSLTSGTGTVNLYDDGWLVFDVPVNSSLKSNGEYTDYPWTSWEYNSVDFGNSINIPKWAFKTTTIQKTKPISNLIADNVTDCAYGLIYVTVSSDVKFPKMTQMDVGEFYGFHVLGKAEFPAKIEYIKDSAFYSSSFSEGLLFDDLSSITSFGQSAFYGCSTLELDLSSATKKPTVAVQCFENLKTSVLRLPANGLLSSATSRLAKTDTGVDVYFGDVASIHVKQNSVVLNGDFSQVSYDPLYFVSNYSLSKVYKEENIKDLTYPSAGMFKNSTLLYVPDFSNVTALGDYCFDSTTFPNDTELYLPNLKEVGNFAFSGSKGLKKVYAPNLSKVGSYAFADYSSSTSKVVDVSSLEDLTVGEDVTFNYANQFAGIPLKKFSGLSNTENIPNGLFASSGVSGSLLLLNLNKVSTIGATSFSSSYVSPRIGKSFASTPGTDAFKNIQAAVRCTEGSYIYTYCVNNDIPYQVYTAVNPTSIELDTTSLTIAQNKQHAFVATLKPAVATETNVAWSSSNPTAGTINSRGVFTALAEGKTTISAVTDNGLVAECTVTVTGPEVLVSSISASDISVAVEETSTLSPVIAPANASNKNLAYSSSAPGVATVSEDGVVTGVSEGSATITITAKDDSAVSTTITVTVEAAVEAGLVLTVDPEEYTNGAVAINAIASGRIASITLPSGVVVENKTFDYNVYRNGKYTFVATTTSGEKITKSATVSNIDTVSPVLKVSSSYRDDATVYTVSATDKGSGIDHVEMPDGSEVAVADLPATFEKDDLGDITFLAYDKAGNVASKDFSRKSLTISGGTTTTFLAYEGIPSKWTNAAATIKLAALNPVDKVTLDVSTTKAVTDSLKAKTLGARALQGDSLSDKLVLKSVTMDSNGDVDVTVTDGLGNTYNDTITVDKIDTEAPTATVTKDGDTYTISADDKLSGIASITTPDGQVVNSNTATITSSTLTSAAVFTVADVAGNMIQVNALSGSSEDITEGDDSSGSGSLDGDIPVNGEVEPDDDTTPAPGTNPGGSTTPGDGEEITDAMISIPSVITFTVKSDRTFVAPQLVFQAKTNRALVVKVTGMTLLNGTTTDIIAPDAHSDWTSLTKEESKAGIALKLGDAWLNESGATIVALSGNETKKVNLTAKYGNVWGNKKVVLQYSLSYQVS